MNRLVTVSREYGSGGRLIGAKIADRLGVPIYDRELIDLAVEKSGLSREIIESAELQAKSGFAYSLSNSFIISKYSLGLGCSSKQPKFLTTLCFGLAPRVGL